MNIFKTLRGAYRYVLYDDDSYFFPDNRNNNGENNMAKIVSAGNGYDLVDNKGSIIKNYTRARDARRGAARLGLTVA